MKEQEWKFVDRTGWPSGEWDNEPDKVQWTDEETRLVCMLHRGPFGNWCGYVGVPPDHRFYGVEYQNVYEREGIDVHGGLTYSDHCSPNFDPETGYGVCHVPEPGEPDDLWWLGFDCGHAFDYQPGMYARLGHLLPEELERCFPRGLDTYRNIAYAKLQCVVLAAQLWEEPCAD